MAETTLLRSNAITNNASPNTTSAKSHAQTSGALPVVQVNMNANGPRVPGGRLAKQGVVLLPPKAGRNIATGGLPNQPAKQGVVILPPMEPRPAASQAALTADQLLLCRHLAGKYLGELRSGTGEAQVEGSVEGSATDNGKLAEATIVAIDAVLAKMTAAAAIAAAPAPSRTVVAGGRSTQATASTAPRRVARPAPAPPPVAVTMMEDRPVVVPSDLNQFENDAQV